MARRATSAPPVLPGYSYVRPLGSGGFADVFLYEQDMPRRQVAVKVLIDDAINPEVLDTFNAEADILARLSAHPSIVTIYQASISADGRPYFVMENCPDSMGTRYKKAPLSTVDVLDVGVRMASALESAHRSDVLHRDIKPSNVLITTMGTPVLADFGIAGAVASPDATPEVFALSIPWSAPEVIQAKVSGSVASEVWSLGATLYTLLAGRTPFDLPSGEKISRDQLQQRIIKSNYVPMGRSDLGHRLEVSIARTLSKDPAARHSSMTELAEELRWAQYDLGLAPTAIEVMENTWSGAEAIQPEGAPRGPVMSTVQTESRRAARAKSLASAQRTQLAPVSKPAKVPARKGAVVVGAIIGAVAAVGVTLGILFAVGVL